MVRSALFLALCLASRLGLAQPVDVAGWEQTRWGMTAEQLRQALGPALVEERSQIGQPIYTTEAKLGGLTLPVRFTLTPGRGLTEVRLGGGWVGYEREQESAAAEAALVTAFGPPQANQVNEQRLPQGGREVSKVYSWSFPNTVVSYRRGFTTGGTEGTQDLVSVSFQMQR
jgi:hypothetical protein